MPRRRGAPAPPGELHVAVEQVGHLAQTIGARPACSELECERVAFDLAADVSDDDGVGILQFSAISGRDGAFTEKLGGGKRQQVGRRSECSLRREAQWLERIDVLALSSQRLAAGRQDRDPRRLQEMLSASAAASPMAVSQLSNTSSISRPRMKSRMPGVGSLAPTTSSRAEASASAAVCTPTFKLRSTKQMPSENVRIAHLRWRAQASSFRLRRARRW